jgi:type II secretory pathway component PulF
MKINLFKKRMTTKEQAFFAKRLVFLLKAGTPIVDSVEIIGNQTKSKYEKDTFIGIVQNMWNGQTLSNSLKKQGGIFSIFSINIIHAGEESGTLISNLDYLANELKKKEILRKKVIGALLYPLIVTVATFGVTGFLAIYIFPKIMPIFQSLNAELPISTRIVMWVTTNLKEHWFILLTSLSCLVITAAAVITKHSGIRYMYYGLILRLPFFGKIIKYYYFANMLRTLGLLLKSGVHLSKAINITSETLTHPFYKKVFSEFKENILKGKTLSENIKKYPNSFPEIISHMIAIGEKSGNLPETLLYLSEFYEYEFDEETKNLSSIIEPVLMIVMGIMVGFIAISVITPIYEITSNIKK